MRKILVFVFFVFLFSNCFSENNKWKIILINGKSYTATEKPVLEKNNYKVKIGDKKLLLQKAIVYKIIKFQKGKPIKVDKKENKKEKIIVINEKTLKQKQIETPNMKKSTKALNELMKKISFRVEKTYRKSSSSKTWSSGNIEFTLKNISFKSLNYLKLKFIWYKSSLNERIKENYLYAVREVPLEPGGVYRGKNTCYYNLSDASTISYKLDIYGTTDGYKYFLIKKNIFVYSNAVDNLKKMQEEKDKIYSKIDKIDEKIRKLEEKIDKLEDRKKEYEYKGYDYKIESANKSIARYKEQIQNYEKQKDELRDSLRKVVR